MCFDISFNTFSQGQMHYTVESDVAIFCNHGCNGSYNYGSDSFISQQTETTADPNHPPESIPGWNHPYNPALVRHLREAMGKPETTLRDISEGEELFCNYLLYIGRADDWKEEVLR